MESTSSSIPPEIWMDAVYTSGALDTREVEWLFDAESHAVYVPSGYLVFVRQGILLAQRFNEARPCGDCERSFRHSRPNGTEFLLIALRHVC
jgi:hypothetical protein